MKVCLQRHARPFMIYRALAIAQAMAEAGHQVSIETLEEQRRVLEFDPGVAWKNPHHPFEVAKRQWRDERGKEHERPAGKAFDAVVSLDGDGPFEVAWAPSGRPWWSWAKEAAKAAVPGLPFIPDWPEIRLKLPDPMLSAEPFILVAVLSEEANPAGVNANALDAFIEARHPGVKRLWSAPWQAKGPQIDFGDRTTLAFRSYPELAAQMARAEAVFSVNGMHAALARSVLRSELGETPLAKRFWYVATAPEDPVVHQPVKSMPMYPLGPAVPRQGTEMREVVAKPDPFSVVRKLLQAPPNPQQGGIVTFGKDMAATETQACPD